MISVLLENHDWFIYNVEIDNQDQTVFFKKNIVATSFTCAAERSKLGNITINVFCEQNVMVIIP